MLLPKPAHTQITMHNELDWHHPILHPFPRLLERINYKIVLYCTDLLYKVN